MLFKIQDQYLMVIYFKYANKQIRINHEVNNKNHNMSISKEK